ncbi:MAG: hypothetical protein M1409_01320 [Actinobacteria bacterium]|nr:hypothetical protein [Actinomycetota bacterium]MCL5408691.1 hypothetical protein [Candidatus Omnitrophota bacterium]
MLRTISGIIKTFIGSLINVTRFLWRRKIWKIRALVIVCLIGTLLYIIVYHFEKPSTTYLILLIYAGIVWIGTAVVEKFIPEDDFKEPLNEYSKYNVKPL